MNNDDLLDLLSGVKVVVSSCEASEHGDNPGCICALKGVVVTVGDMHKSVFAGTPTWNLKGVNKRVRLSEITLLKNGDIP